MITIDNLTFYKTCDACPEQYEVRDENDKEVGYVRLRWGYLRADYPCCGGETIYDADMDNDWTGCFTSEEERMEHLTKIAKAIRERMRERMTRIVLGKNTMKVYKNNGECCYTFVDEGDGFVYDKENLYMKTTEEVRKELNEATKLQRETSRVVNEALCHAAGKLDKLEEEYNRGLNDCWRMVKKVTNMTQLERMETFGDSHPFIRQIIGYFTPQEALEKIRLWEEKKAEEERKKKEEAEKIRIGDVVEITDKYLNRRRGIFLKDNGGTFDLLTKSEYTSNLTELGFSASRWTIQKTGEHVDILGVLRD